jgi:hypothetical protein
MTLLTYGSPFQETDSMGKVDSKSGVVFTFLRFLRFLLLTWFPCHDSDYFALERISCSERCTIQCVGMQINQFVSVAFCTTHTLFRNYVHFNSASHLHESLQKQQKSTPSTSLPRFLSQSNIMRLRNLKPWLLSTTDPWCDSIISTLIILHYPFLLGICNCSYSRCLFLSWCKRSENIKW